MPMTGERYVRSRGGKGRGAGSVALLLCALVLGACSGAAPAAEVPAPQDQQPLTAAASEAPPTTAPSPTAAPSSTPTVEPTASPVPEPPTAAAGELTSSDDVQRIGLAEAKALLDAGQAVLYDVRTAESYQASHAAGALSLPYSEIESLLPTLPRDKILILYCT
jgi:PBP1b-binding outer membrane lipoprotein LpoB